MELLKVFFDGSNEVIDILSDKYLHHECSTWLEELFTQIEYGEVEFDALILIDSFLTSSFRSDIRGNQIK